MVSGFLHPKVDLPCLRQAADTSGGLAQLLNATYGLVFGRSQQLVGIVEGSRCDAFVDGLFIVHVDETLFCRDTEVRDNR
jgi:hypothetical protein